MVPNPVVVAPYRRHVEYRGHVYYGHGYRGHVTHFGHYHR